MTRTALVLVLVLVLGRAATVADDTPSKPAPAAAKDGVLAFPSIRIHAKEKRIEVDAWVAQRDVLLEYILVASHGKLHESLFGTDCDPEMLELGLILLELEAKPQVSYQGQPKALEGDAVSIEAEWDEPAAAGGGDGGGGAPKRVRVAVAELIRNPYARAGAATVEAPGRFVFTGSKFIENPEIRFVDEEKAATLPKEVLAAKASGNLVALYHDPEAILDNPLPTGGDIPLLLPSLQSPELLGWIGGDDFHRADTARIPPRGTKVLLHIRPAP